MIRTDSPGTTSRASGTRSFRVEPSSRETSASSPSRACTLPVTTRTLQTIGHPRAPASSRQTRYALLAVEDALAAELGLEDHARQLEVLVERVGCGVGIVRDARL